MAPPACALSVAAVACRPSGLPAPPGLHWRSRPPGSWPSVLTLRRRVQRRRARGLRQGFATSHQLMDAPVSHSEVLLPSAGGAAGLFAVDDMRDMDCEDDACSLASMVAASVAAKSVKLLGDWLHTGSDHAASDLFSGYTGAMASTATTSTFLDTHLEALNVLDIVVGFADDCEPWTAEPHVRSMSQPGSGQCDFAQQTAEPHVGNIVQPESGKFISAQRTAEPHVRHMFQPESGQCDFAQQTAEPHVRAIVQPESGKCVSAQRTAEPDVRHIFQRDSGQPEAQPEPAEWLAETRLELEQILEGLSSLGKQVQHFVLATTSKLASFDDRLCGMERLCSPLDGAAARLRCLELRMADCITGPEVEWRFKGFAVSRDDLKAELKRFSNTTGFMSTISELSSRCRELEVSRDLMNMRFNALNPEDKAAGAIAQPQDIDPYADPSTLAPRLAKGSAVLVGDESWSGLRRGVILDQNPCDAGFADVRLDGAAPYSDEWFFVAAWDSIVPAATAHVPPPPPPAPRQAGPRRPASSSSGSDSISQQSPPRRVRAHRR